MGLVKTAAKVAVASSVHGRVQRRQQARWAAQDAAAAGQVAPLPGAVVAPVPGPTAAMPEDPLVAQLRQLASLHGAGIINDAEFTAKAVMLLGT